MTKGYILLVDDEAPFVTTMSKRLMKRDFSVATALNGQAALEILSSNQEIEVVILDVKMPGMDGIETLRRIKGGFPLVEVLMLTGHATIEDAISGMKLGAFDYLMKPCELDELIAKAEEAMRIKRKHEEKITQARLREITLRRV